MRARVDGAYEGALRAFKSPMLALLHKRYAPLVVTVLSSVFTSARPVVPVAEAHTEVDDALDQLRSAGHDGIPDGGARDLCRDWVNAGWLIRQVDDGDAENYRLSAHAVGALEVAGRAGGARGRVTESRVRTLLEAVDRLAQDSDPDVLTRMARLDAEIRQRQTELERLEVTGTVEEVDDEVLVEEAENVLALVRELPADFARVAESIKAIQRDVVAALRQDERPTGEVLAEYLERADELLSATAEGRAFAGALRLIDDRERLDNLAAQLDVVLRHRFARQLPAHQRAELRSITRQIETGLDDVLTAQRRASRVITTQVRHHDPLRDRQVDELLREAISGLSAWVPGSRPGEAVEVAPRLPRAHVGNLRETLHDLRPAVPPEPLADWDDDGDHGSLDDARVWGGPHYGELAAYLRRLAERLEAGAGLDVGQAFEQAPDELRRPVDLIGLLELAEDTGEAEPDEISFVTAVRPDGSRRRLAFGRAAVRTPDDETIEEVRG
ncbi:DUF3375 domain-containing protein [Isoptericola croceus]|uniref:DUF3375 domain-containing protein n=1 Tax=Isoptericola croceus TaxID=3031406 RepID=UPI0023F876C8|nr:DUF3375 domain-containing protein [Isoptericola croceus]